MKSKRIKLNLFLVIIGILLLCFGFVLLKENWFVKWKYLPYVFVGIGCGVFGHNIGAIIQIKTIEKNPEKMQEIRIEQNDERNTAIRNVAKSKAFDAMVYIFGAIMLLSVLLSVKFTFILLLVGAYLLVNGIMIYYMYKFEKEM